MNDFPYSGDFERNENEDANNNERSFERSYLKVRG